MNPPPPPLRRSRLLFLLAAAPLASAVDLPVTAVTFTPQGAVVTRSGDLPAHDDTVTGIPADSARGSLLVAVAGIDLPAWHVALPAPPLDDGPHPDPAAVAALRAAISAAQDDRARADLRAHLADIVANAPPPADAANPAPPAIPTPAALQARLDFATANAERATADAAAADAAVIQATAKLDALTAATAREIPDSGAALVIPGAGGHHVDITYRVEHATWGPAYRVEVTGERVKLVLLARANLDAGADRWGAIPIDFTTRPPDHPAMLPSLAIPQLGLGDTVDGVADPREPYPGGFFARMGGGRRHALGAASATDASLRAGITAQSADGSWGDEPYRTAATALRTLTYLFAGFDQRTPSKYQSTVRKAVDVLIAIDPAHASLDDLALTTQTLAEAFALSGDGSLKDPLDRDVSALRERAFTGNGLADAIAAAGSDGPLVAVHVAFALKSAVVALIDVGDGFAQLRSVLPQVESGRDRSLGRIAGGTIRLMLGEHPQVSLTEAQVWASMVPDWFAHGRVEELHLAILDAFQAGPPAWPALDHAARDFLIHHQDAGGLYHVPGSTSDDISESICALCLEIYYRYSSVSPKKEESPEADSDGSFVAASDVPFAPIPDGADASTAGHAWPLHWTTPTPVALVPGTRAEIVIATCDLPGAVELSAIPQQATSVWRALHTVNPLNQPLPAATAEVVVDGTPCGSTAVPFTLPGKNLVLALGREAALRIERAATVTSDDGIRTRTLHVQIGYRLVAPPGWTRHVSVIEPMPVSDGAVTLAVPDLDGQQLQKRLATDPLWHLDVAPGVVPVLSYTIAYPASLRPYLEYQQ
jgi:hypothetical protein